MGISTFWPCGWGRGGVVQVQVHGKKIDNLNSARFEIFCPYLLLAEFEVRTAS